MSRNLQADDVSTGDPITVILDNEHIRGEVTDIVRSQNHSSVSELHVAAPDETLHLLLYKTRSPDTATVKRFGDDDKLKDTDLTAEFDLGP